jgi:hypothetical protein
MLLKDRLDRWEDGNIHPTDQAASEIVVHKTGARIRVPSKL